MVSGSPYTDDYDYDSGRLVFPSVTRLVYRLFRSNLSAFVHTLEMCPNIQILDLRGHTTMDAEAASRDYGRLAELAVNVTHIHIHAVDNMHRTIVALHTPHRRTFIVDLTWCQLPEGTLCSIFSDLRQGVRLSISCSRRPGTTHFPYWDIDGTDCQGMHRGLYQCREDTVQTLWNYLSPLSLSEISIDVALLGGVLGTHSVYPGVHELTISITDIDAFAFPETGSTPHFPDLRLLRLAVAKSLSMLFISASSLASFISDLRIDGGVLAELVLENVTMEGGIAEVAAVVDEH
ncbi:hypothetical protein EXIGLDRAFT_729269 [Exidia glandulosa HHB12029]|uniref:F-box domain-containing protein n=1 Tax=Exidia glandulosa HHB12029 TaxID=1314781 RepID=A0A165CP72_EXIGL|nr:hypothetical protein EXIGLDRAFT_729269 [Exidia glandulosa HHB12029]